MLKKHFFQFSKMASTVEAKAVLRTEIASKLAKLTSEEKLRQSKVVYLKVRKSFLIRYDHDQVQVFGKTFYKIFENCFFQNSKNCSSW